MLVHEIPTTSYPPFSMYVSIFSCLFSFNSSVKGIPNSRGTSKNSTSSPRFLKTLPTASTDDGEKLSSDMSARKISPGSLYRPSKWLSLEGHGPLSVFSTISAPGLIKSVFILPPLS